MPPKGNFPCRWGAQIRQGQGRIRFAGSDIARLDVGAMARWNRLLLLLLERLLLHLLHLTGLHPPHALVCRMQH
jgi:hypothetical protein